MKKALARAGALNIGTYLHHPPLNPSHWRVIRPFFKDTSAVTIGFRFPTQCFAPGDRRFPKDLWKTHQDKGI
jgi:hypothetical protein